MRVALRVILPVAVAGTVGACAGPLAAPGTALPPLAPPPPAAGSLALRVVYPPPPDTTAVRAGESRVADAAPSYRIEAHDSTFLFGSVGRGDARVTVNGYPVAVYPTGGWLAWVPIAGDSIAVFDIVAVAAGDTARLTYRAVVAPRFAPPPVGVWIDTTTLQPVGNVWVEPGEGVTVRVRASPEAALRLLLPDDREVPLVADPSAVGRPRGLDAFDTTPGGRPRPSAAGRYVGWAVGAVGHDPGPVVGPTVDSGAGGADTGVVMIEAALDGDTVRYAWPLHVGVLDPVHPVVVRLDDDTAGTGDTDSITTGRPVPHGTYHWFFPTGTLATVSGRQNDQVRLALAAGVTAWVNVDDVVPLPLGTPPVHAIAESPRMVHDSAEVALRVPVSARVPFRVDEDECRLTLTLYGAAADMDWIRHGPADPLIERVAFDQPRSDVVTVTVFLSTPAWGYRTRWVGSDLVLEIRRPPVGDPHHPLRDRVIALDAGHPPLGATGPTGVREPDVTLAVVRRAARLFEEAGARVVLTRADSLPVSLLDRVRRAEDANAEVLVSVHANALPDGVNPFTNNGTSVFFFQPYGADLARALDRALVAQLGFRDLGYARGDLALARPTWMPAALAEGLFLMLPDQEAVLNRAEGQERYAQGIVRGVSAFLASRRAPPH